MPASDEIQSQTQVGPTAWPSDPDDWWWEDKATELRHTGLDRVRESAKNWETSIATLLGVFATVAFVKGPDTFKDLSGWPRWLAAFLVLAAALVAASALILAGVISQGMPRLYGYIGGERLKRWTQETSKSAIRLLWWSRGLALAAVLLIFAATATTWFASFTQKKTASSVETVAVLGDSHVICGALTRKAGTNELSLAVSMGRTKAVTHKSGKTTTTSTTVTTTVPLSGARSVTPVDSCP